MTEQEQITHEKICCRIVDELNKSGITYGIGIDGDMYFANHEDKLRGEKIIKRCYREQMLKGGDGND